MRKLGIGILCVPFCLSAFVAIMYLFSVKTTNDNQTTNIKNHLPYCREMD
jgi:hypothetical protein